MQELGSMLRHPAGGRKIKDALLFLPRIGISCTIAPITRTVLRVVLTLRPEFQWRDSAHGAAMRWVLWVEDSQNDMIYHNDVWTLTKKMMQVRARPPQRTARSTQHGHASARCSCRCTSCTAPPRMHVGFIRSLGLEAARKQCRRLTAACI